MTRYCTCFEVTNVPCYMLNVMCKRNQIQLSLLSQPAVSTVSQQCLQAIEADLQGCGPSPEHVIRQQ